MRSALLLHSRLSIDNEAHTHLVPLQGHEVALDVGDVDEVLLARLAPEEAVAPGAAEVRHLAALDLALNTGNIELVKMFSLWKRVNLKPSL